MEILLNGAPQQVPDGLSTAELLERMELAGQRVAVEINREIVPRSAYAQRRLRPGDQVEVVRAIGGG